MKPVRGVQFVLFAGLLSSAGLFAVGCSSSNGSSHPGADAGGGHGGVAGGTGGTAGTVVVVDASTDFGVVDSGSYDASPLARVLASFDPFGDASPGLQGFVLDPTDTGPGNLGVASDGGAAATLAWTGTDGSPLPGALVSEVPFDDHGQFIDLRKSYGTSFPQDWTGKQTLHARVKVASGLGSGAAIQLYAQSFAGTPDGGPTSTCPPKPAECHVPANNPIDGGALTFLPCSSVTSVPAGNGWNDYTLNLRSCAAPFALDSIVSFGVIVQSGAAPSADAGATDGGANPTDAGANPTAAVVSFDTFAVE